MTVPGSPTVRRRRLAAELREIRESKGKSGDAVAAALRWSPSKISRYERAKTGLQPREVERLLDYYEITGARRQLLLDLAEDATLKGWWEEYGDNLSADYRQFIGLEDEASAMAGWHVDVIPGLFQTEAYARHIIGTYRQIEPVTPGMIDTPLWRARLSEPEQLSFFAKVGAELPVGRAGLPDDIAHAVQFLLENGFITGSVVDVDGGQR